MPRSIVRTIQEFLSLENLLRQSISNHIRDRSLFIPGVGTEEIWVG